VAQLNDFVATHLGVIGVVIVVGCVVLVLMILMLFIQSRRIALLSERLDDLTQGADGQSLEGVLDTHIDTVMRVARDLDELVARTAMLEGGARLHFGRLGIVRFNPFDDTGGNQSFALAMLDANNDGFVFSSLHSRTGTRLYAKAIFGGQSETTLGAEEAQAVEIAVSQGGGTPASKATKAAAARIAAGKSVGRGKTTGSTSRPARTVVAAPAAVPAPAAVREAAPVAVPVAVAIREAAPVAIREAAPVAVESASADGQTPDAPTAPAEAGSATPSV
jgi:hypothetical protein